MDKKITLEISERALEHLKFLLGEWVNDEEIRDILDNTDEGCDLDEDEYEERVNEWCEDIDTVYRQLNK